MGNEVGMAEKNALSVSYDVYGTNVSLDIDFVKRYLVRGQADLVTDQELVFFMNLCKMQRLNPLNGYDCYLIKYSKNDPAQMVVGKSAYMRRAFEHPDYLCKEDGIVVQRGDQFIEKEGCCLYPGEVLIGGWCRVHYMRAGCERTAFKEVSLAEYDKGMANWKARPALMINKVAVSQCVREAFPKDYEGLYSEEELVASGVIQSDYKEVESKVVEPEREPIKELCEMIEEAIDDKSWYKKVFYEVINRLGLESREALKVEHLAEASRIIKELAEQIKSASTANATDEE